MVFTMCFGKQCAFQYPSFNDVSCVTWCLFSYLSLQTLQGPSINIYSKLKADRATQNFKQLECSTVCSSVCCHDNFAIIDPVSFQFGLKILEKCINFLINAFLQKIFGVTSVIVLITDIVIEIRFHSLNSTMGGAVASWLVPLSLNRVVRNRALARHIVSCSWAKHFTLTVPLPTQVYKWVTVNLMLGVTLRWTTIPSRGE